MKTIKSILCLFVLLLVAVPAVDAFTVDSMTPKVGYKESSATLTITGVNFSTSNMDVRIKKSGEDNITASISSTTSTQIVCVFSTIKMNDAETGEWDIVVINPDGSEVVKSDWFTVRSKIKISSVTPTKARTNSENMKMSVSGSGLDEITGMYLHSDDNGNITGSNVDVKSSTKVNATFDFNNKELDTYVVCLKDDFNTIVCNNDVEFEVTSDEVGSLDVTSSPSGATLYLDGVSKGTTPINLTDLDVGTYKIIVKKDGYVDWMRAISIKSGTTTSYTANLEVKTTATTATSTSTPTTIPTSIKVTRKQTSATPTPWPSDTPTPASPLDALVIVGGIGLALVALRRK